MGVEGICARSYYQALRYFFPPQWNFTGRNRRPPLDPINALLSWGYGVLLARVFSACVQVGLDPYLGFFHATEPYRPNLVLDVMEEFYRQHPESRGKARVIMRPHADTESAKCRADWHRLVYSQIGKGGQKFMVIFVN